MKRLRYYTYVLLLYQVKNNIDAHYLQMMSNKYHTFINNYIS